MSLNTSLKLDPLKDSKKSKVFGSKVKEGKKKQKGNNQKKFYWQLIPVDDGESFYIVNIKFIFWRNKFITIFRIISKINYGFNTMRNNVVNKLMMRMSILTQVIMC